MYFNGQWLWTKKIGFYFRSEIVKYLVFFRQYTEALHWEKRFTKAMRI